MVGFLPRPVAESKTVKDLQTATLEAVCLPRVDFCVSLVNNAGIDTAVRHPSSSHQTLVINDVSDHLRLSAYVSSYPAGPAPMMSLEQSQLSIDKVQKGRVLARTDTSIFDSVVAPFAFAWL